ncbi:DUF58 domain-containing protein [Metabacillus litoralis]|uniref:DUF58 domain-containing protein n=1 Tax=Metabacillus litoralis TaxID=152268 RepID=UPI002041106E|nr:DUF58 domain-containing protein [Metabacillus litoralis]MCM3655310.1 DUF58 domain-containing protein [Metabacillus litoralis]
MKEFYKKLRAVWKLVSLLFLTLAAFSYAMFQGGFVSWFLFYSFFPFAVYSLLLLLYPIRSFMASRTVSQEQYTVGQRLIGTITIKRRFPFPLFYLLVEDEMTEKLQGSKKVSEPKKLFFPWFKRRVSFSYVLLELPRGEHQLSAIRIRTGDFFGLIEKEVTFEVENTFLVYPPFVNFRYYPQQRRFEQGSASTVANYLHDSTMAVGIREYQAGDKLSWIDWKATARRDSIMTKEFEQMQSHDVVIILDRTKSDMFESIVTYTASFIRAIMKSGARVGLISIGCDRHIFPLQSDEEHGRNMFYHLAKVDCDSKEPLSTLLEKDVFKTEMKQVTNIIVTSQLTLDFARRLEYLVKLQQSYMLFVIKSVHDETLNEEKILIERLKKLHIDVKVISSRDDGRGYKEVREV